MSDIKIESIRKNINNERNILYLAMKRFFDFTYNSNVRNKLRSKMNLLKLSGIVG